MKQIDISTPKHPNTFALVDDIDYECLNKHKWTAVKYGKTLYATRHVRVNDKRTTIGMHTEILGQIHDREGDHWNGNGLDNQRHNLRHCTHAENQRNKALQGNNTSGYKGVSWNRKLCKWKSQIKLNGEIIYLGYYFCLIKAAKTYDRAALEYHGRFAKLNFKEN